MIVRSPGLFSKSMCGVQLRMSPYKRSGERTDGWIDMVKSSYSFILDKNKYNIWDLMQSLRFESRRTNPVYKHVCLFVLRTPPYNLKSVQTIKSEL